MTSTSYAVDGMSCGHCVSAVTAGLSSLPGVETVEVDLVAGGTSTVIVTGTAPMSRRTVAEALDEAGYALHDYR